MQNIARVTAWAFAGKHYPTEREAIEANLKAIMDRILKDHSANILGGVLAHRDELAPLLSRHAELAMATAEDPLADTRGTRRDGTGGTHREGPIDGDPLTEGPFEGEGA